MNINNDNAKTNNLISREKLNELQYIKKVLLIVCTVNSIVVGNYLYSGIGKIGAGGLWIAAFVFGIGGLFYKFFTQKVARGSFSGVGFGGFFAGSFTISLPKTDEEISKDQRFFSIFMKSFPAIWMMLCISVVATTFIGMLPIPDNAQYVLDAIAVVGLTVSPYFALKKIASWDPKDIKHEWLKALIHAILMMPFYFILTLAAISCIDWMFFFK